MIELAAVARFLNLAASISLAGIFAFLLFVARPAFDRAMPHVIRDFSMFVGTQNRIAGWWTAIAFAASISGLFLQALYVNDSAAGQHVGPREMGVLVRETHFGFVWMLRTLLLVVLVCWIAFARSMSLRHPMRFLTIGFLLSALFLATFALSGHAASGEGLSSVIQAVLDMIHLLACGAWLGGLFAFAELLRLCISKEHAGNGIVATAATARFSQISLVSVLILILTGLYSAWKLLGAFAPLIATQYGKLLLLKICLLIPMLGFGAMNLLVLKPRLVASVSSSQGATARIISRLRRNVRIELVLGISIVLVVAHLGLSTPATHVQPEWPLSFRWDFGALGRSPNASVRTASGMALGAIGFIALLYFAFRKRWREAAAIVSVGSWLGAGLAIIPALSVDAYPTTYLRPTMPYEAISVAAGRRLYGNSGCPACHGESGYGNGPMAANLTPKPADLTAPHADSHTAGDLYWWISYGIKGSAMPGFASRLDEEDRWDLINFMRALSDSEKARSMGPVVEEEPWLIAPDFSFESGDNEVRTLRDYRGLAAVLLVLGDEGEISGRLQQLSRILPELRSSGLEMIVVTTDQPDKRLRKSVVEDGSRVITQTYSLLARSALDEGLLTGSKHVEFLIDRQGYIRARWLPSEGDAWEDGRSLVAQANILRREKPHAPAPEWHGH